MRVFFLYRDSELCYNGFCSVSAPLSKERKGVKKYIEGFFPKEDFSKGITTKIEKLLKTNPKAYVYFLENSYLWEVSPEKISGCNVVFAGKFTRKNFIDNSDFWLSAANDLNYCSDGQKKVTIDENGYSHGKRVKKV